MGFMVILGKDERAKFEAIRDTLSNAVCKQYDEAKTYHDGKWVMFEPTNTADFDDYMKLLASKRKPNRKWQISVLLSHENISISEELSL